MSAWWNQNVISFVFHHHFIHSITSEEKLWLSLSLPSCSEESYSVIDYALRDQIWVGPCQAEDLNLSPIRSTASMLSSKPSGASHLLQLRFRSNHSGETVTMILGTELLWVATPSFFFFLLFSPNKEAKVVYRLLLISLLFSETGDASLFSSHCRVTHCCRSQCFVIVARLYKNKKLWFTSHLLIFTCFQTDVWKFRLCRSHIVIGYWLDISQKMNIG